MPRLLDDNMKVDNIQGMQKFQFSHTRIEDLGATEYTLVTIAIDVTGSVSSFSDELRKSLLSVVESCKKSPRANNLLLRVVMFSSTLKDNIEELHGFKLLSEIDVNQYPTFKPSGMTPLYDAMFSSVGATLAYSKKLVDQDFSTNGIVFIITDGCDNASTVSCRMIKNAINEGLRSEETESLIGILIGINASDCGRELQHVEIDSGMKYVDAGEATKGKLAKLAEFVSQSISSQSQSLGTGSPSQNIAATI